jgi:uncharacterized protein YidB (DUF937 family)
MGLLDDVLGGLGGGTAGGGLGGMLGGALGGSRGAAGGGMQRMLVQAVIAMIVANAARGAMGGARGGAGLPGAGGGLGGLLGGLLGGGGLGAMLGGGAGAAGPGGLLGPLLDAFTQHGHGDAAASWVGRGANQPVSPQAVDQVFGPDAIDSIARQLGIGREEAASGIAQVLPQVVDHLTPDGSLPDPGRQAASLEDLARQLGPQ